MPDTYTFCPSRYGAVAELQCQTAEEEKELARMIEKGISRIGKQKEDPYCGNFGQGGFCFYSKNKARAINLDRFTSIVYHARQNRGCSLKLEL